MSFAKRIVKLRSSAPPWFDKVISGIVASESPIATAMKSMLAVGSTIPSPPHPQTDARIRVLIAPFNYAGQAEMWAQSLRTLNPNPHISASSLSIGVGGFAFPATTSVPAAVFIGSRDWRSRLEASLSEYTHVLIESFGSLRGRGTGEVILPEIDAMQRRGIRVALVCHGSDIRSPRDAANRTDGPPLSVWGSRLERLQRTADENKRVLDAFSGPVFVSTPDLLRDVPHATWLPVVINPTPWAEASRAKPHRSPSVLRVLHVPSNAAVKGSDTIQAVAEKLHAKGIIEYHRAAQTPHHDMPALLAEADVVIDQLLAGSYGVAACEAMAANKAVVSHVSPDVRAHAKEAAGMALPIVEATGASLEETLIRLAETPNEVAVAQDAGPEFVRRLHAGRSTPAALSSFLEIPKTLER